MTIYEHITTLIVVGGSANSVTFNIPGGTAKYLLIRSNTATTVFRASFSDKNGITRLNYDYHEGEIVDDKLDYPITGRYNVNITNSSPNDTFQIIFSVKEGR